MRWEYRRIYSLLMDRGEYSLDALGEEGWELVGLFRDDWVFKRPLTSAAK